MHQAMNKILLMIGACTIALASLAATPKAHANRLIAGCLSLSGVRDSNSVLQQARKVTSDSAYAHLRSSRSIPTVVPDSVQFYSVGLACDSVAAAYQVLRLGDGSPNVLIPVVLLRLGATKAYLGTALINLGGNAARYREFVVLDSAFAIKGRFSLGS